MLRKLAIALLPAITATALAVSTGQASATRAEPTTTTRSEAPEKSAPSTHTVQTGETLSLIAQRQLGDTRHWQSIYEINKGIIGPDPNFIRLGQSLALPTGHRKPYTGENEAKTTTPRHAKPKATDTESRNGMWDRLAQCESSGDWSISTGNGYYGGLQFSLSTWREHGGNGMPQDASREEQIRIAEKVLADQGPGAWPVCSFDAGMR
ncbi:transglycosylase family protein [Streptomyces sp. UNOC14_S4]|uniref:transglycosylase family protein n=1 Tax=Streptomyces sp. UNOC14_S4 TaxID=2872340 RepID=UPI0035B310F9|nr:transglycosylase family protein [Streptomyces sp. UNOC14_S4]